MFKNYTSKVMVAGMALSFSSLAFAEDVTITVPVKKIKLGADLHAGYTYDDQKLNEHDGIDDVPTTSTFKLHKFRAKLTGEIMDDVAFYYRYNMGTSSSEYAKLTWTVMPNLELTFGKDKAKQGGWEIKRSSAQTLVYSDYKDNLPHSSYEDTFSIAYQMQGTLTLQLLNDTGGAYNNTRQPAAIFEWVGDYGAVKPLLQYGIFDNSKSNHLTVGVKFAQNGLDVEFDYSMQNETSGSGDAETTDKVSNMALNVAYDMGGLAPFFQFSMFDRKQDGDDLKGNYWESGESPEFHDNGQTWLIGTHLMSDKKFRPYVAASGHSGKFYKAALADTDGDGNIDSRPNYDADTESLSGMKVMMGFMSSF